MIEIHHVYDTELRGAYEYLYDERPIRHSDSLYLWMLKLLALKPGCMLLDIACGQCRLSELAEAKGVHAYGFDLSYQAVITSTLKGKRVLVCNGEALAFPNRKFDYVTNIGSLEHYVDPLTGAREMSRVLKPGGVACILLPNTFGLFSTVLYHSNTGRLADDGQPIQRYGTRQAWQELLEAGGLTVLEVHKYETEWPLTLKDWGLYIRSPKRFLRLMLTPFLPVNLANSFVFLCSVV